MIISAPSIVEITFIAAASINIPADIFSIILPILSLLPPPGNLDIPMRTPYNTVTSPNVIIPFAISLLSIPAIILIESAISIKLADIARIPTPAFLASLPASLVAAITAIRIVNIPAIPLSPFRISSGFIFASFFMERTTIYNDAAIASKPLALASDLNFPEDHCMIAYIAAIAPIRIIRVLVAPSISPLAVASLFNA